MRYKKLIRNQITKHKQVHPDFRYCHLAERMGIEPSYLSRFFTSVEVHFSDELLFELLTQLNMDHEGIDHIFTLKEFERCSHPLRKRFLEEKLNLMKVKKLGYEFERIKKSLSDTLKLLSRGQ
ncbi:MAG: hypothetical protein H7333_04210 [Bdellovibrionales bacterium]|nr:hypothetical protein [Oligoflexia bacterium]